MFVGLGDEGVVVSERGMLVGVGELVEDHAGLSGVDPVDEVGGVGDLDACCFVGVVSVVSKPFGIGVVAGAGEAGVVVLDPDVGLLECCVGAWRGLGECLLELTAEEIERGGGGLGVIHRGLGDVDGETLDGLDRVLIGGFVDEWWGD